MRISGNVSNQLKGLATRSRNEAPKESSAQSDPIHTGQDGVNLSQTASAKTPSKSVLGRWGKTAAALALAGLVLGASGCAVTGGVRYEQSYGVTQTYEQTISVGQYSYGGYGGYNQYGGYGQVQQYQWGSGGGSYYQYGSANHGCVTNSWGGGVCY